MHRFIHTALLRPHTPSKIEKVDFGDMRPYNILARLVQDCTPEFGANRFLLQREVRTCPELKSYAQIYSYSFAWRSQPLKSRKMSILVKVDPITH